MIEESFRAQLSPERQLHIDIMERVARNFSDTPFVLKGGTALLLAYKLDRFSTDLDFDSGKRLGVISRIKTAFPSEVKVLEIREKKDSSVAQRYDVDYHSKFGKDTLKIETSYRTPPQESDVQVVNGIRVYKLSKLIDQKLQTVQSRTKSRDLYDVAFLGTRHADQFSFKQADDFTKLVKEFRNLSEAFKDAFIDDGIMRSIGFESTLYRLIEAEERFLKLQQHGFNKATIEELSEIRKSVKEGKVGQEEAQKKADQLLRVNKIEGFSEKAKTRSEIKEFLSGKQNLSAEIICRNAAKQAIAVKSEAKIQKPKLKLL